MSHSVDWTAVIIFVGIAWSIAAVRIVYHLTHRKTPKKERRKEWEDCRPQPAAPARELG